MVELYVEGVKVDISQDMSTVLSFSIDDIKDFAAKNSPVSKTIVLPGTKNNNKLFGNVFDISASNSFDPTISNQGINFNAAITARAVLFNGNIQCMKGVLQILEITVDNDYIEYEVGIWGELTGFVASMAAKLLTGNTNDDGTPNTSADLDFSAYNQTYSIANIVASWSNTGGNGIYYPLIDYGNYSVDKHNWNVGTFRPALYVKEYIDKIFAAAGYTYDCDLFNTDRFKKLVVPHNQKTLTRKSGNQLDISIATTYTFTVFDDAIPFDTLTSLGSFTSSDSNSKFTYTGSNIIGNLILKVVGNNGRQDGIFFSVTKNTGGVGFDEEVARAYMIYDDDGNYTANIEIDNLSISNGDYIRLYFNFDNPEPYYGTSISITSANLILTGSGLDNIQVNLGESLKVNGCIPNNITQVDFISSIIKLFQLYVYEDPNIDKHLLITPFVDMFNNSVTQDWSKKLDRSKPYKLKPLSELNARYYEFKYKSDSDYYNDLYKKAYNLEYGSFRYDSNYQFSKDSITVDIIFSGTPIVGYTGEDKVYSTIMKRTGNTSPYVEESVDSNIRILQTKLVTGVTSWNILAADGTTVLGSYTNYPYAGHFDDPDAPSNDLNFGVPNELYFVLLAGSINVNQFNVYWSTYLREITDKDAKMLIGQFNLSLRDLANLKFGNYINIDGNLFRINKIGDFNITKPNLCECELIKVNNLINF